MSTPDVTKNVGKWSQEENELFVEGCVLYGWGNWAVMEKFVRTRTRCQLKSHAQKYQKRQPEEKRRLIVMHDAQKSKRRISKKGNIATTKSKPLLKKRKVHRHRVVSEKYPSYPASESDGKKLPDTSCAKGSTKKDTVTTSPIKTPSFRPRRSKKDFDPSARVQLATEPKEAKKSGSPLLPWIGALPESNRATASNITNNTEGGGSDFHFLNKEDNLVQFNLNEPSEDTPIDPLSTKEIQHLSCNAVGSLRNEIKYDKLLYDEVHQTLTACPDFNNKHEYVVRSGGMTRTALGGPALMRARIKLMLERHEKLGWWESKEVSDDNIAYAEHFLALAVVMYDVTNWSLRSVGGGNDFTASKFEEDDDILHIGQMMSDLWERVDRSLSREKYSMLGSDGFERGRATQMIISIIVGSSRMTISGFA